jgi:TPR repeat protein
MPEEEETRNPLKRSHADDQSHKRQKFEMDGTEGALTHTSDSSKEVYDSPGSSSGSSTLQESGKEHKPKRVEEIALEPLVPLGELHVDPALEHNEYHALPFPELLKRANANEAEALYILGMRWFYGIGQAADERSGWKLIVSAARHGHPVSLAGCLRFGVATEANVELAIRLFQESALRGHPAAISNLAHCYLHGEGVPEDPAQAVRLLRLAAQQNYCVALTGLARCYRRGIGTVENLVESARLYALAAEQDHASAIVNLGLCYLNGEGVPEDSQLAVELYRRAVEYKSSEAMYLLGYCYRHGDGVDADSDAAFELYKQAAARQHPEAMRELASCYELGVGVVRNAHMAGYLYRIISDQSESEILLDDLHLRQECTLSRFK